MRLAIFLLGAMCCWGALLFTLARGVFVIPAPDIRGVAGRAVRWSLFGLPIYFALALAAGELTGLIPMAHRWQPAALASLVSLPFYSMLLLVTEVGKGKRWPRNPARFVRFVSQLLVFVVSVIALGVTLAGLGSTAGPFMGR